MTAFGKLIRTTAFRLTLVYLFLFALFAASLLGYFAWNTRRMINEQITTTVNREVADAVGGLFGRADIATRQHFDARLQFGERIGLWQIVVATGAQALDAVIDLA